MRINGPIFFGAASYVSAQLQRIDERDPAHQHLLIVASGVNFVDYEGAQLLAHEAHRRRRIGGSLAVFHMKDEPMNLMRQTGALKDVGEEHFHTMGDDVIGTIYRRLDADICARCTVRIFAPCKKAPKASPAPEPDAGSKPAPD